MSELVDDFAQRQAEEGLAWASLSGCSDETFLKPIKNRVIAEVFLRCAMSAIGTKGGDVNIPNHISVTIARRVLSSPSPVTPLTMTTTDFWTLLLVTLLERFLSRSDRIWRVQAMPNSVVAPSRGSATSPSLTLGAFSPSLPNPG